MKILVLNYEFPPLGGGGAPFSSGIAYELATRGHTVHVITSSFKGLPKEERSSIYIRRVPVLRQHLGYCNAFEMLTYIIFGFFPTLFACYREKYDLIHVHFFIPTGIISWLLKKFYRIPIILTAHGSDVPGYDPDLFVKICHVFLAPFFQKIVRSTNVVICPSSYLENLLLKYCPAVKTVVIPNGMAISAPSDVSRKKIILIVSRFFKRKGIDIFLRSLASFETDWVVNIVGDGPQKNELLVISKAMNIKVNFFGWLDREPDQYKQFFQEASIFVFLSSSENFPMVLMDAMRHGVAILASNIPGNQEVLKDTGVLVNRDNMDSIRNNIKLLIENEPLRIKMGQESKERFEKNFTWKIIGDRYEELFNKIFNKSETYQSSK